MTPPPTTTTAPLPYIYAVISVNGIAEGVALHGPFPDVVFCPTGGIAAEAASTFLALPNVACVGGSWLCPAADIRSGNWAGITAMCDRAIKSLKPAVR